jgi:DNA-binding response OmpR family regulator
MKFRSFGIGIFIVCLLLTVQVCSAYPTEDYSKVLILHLTFSNGTINDQSVEMQYGHPPTLGFQSGNLHGTLKTSDGLVLQEFDLSDPRYQLSDKGVLTYSDTADFTIVVPYYPGETTLDLTDKSTGTLLKTVNFLDAINQFQATYPNDPDMVTNPGMQSLVAGPLPVSQPGALGSVMILLQATMFSSSVFLEAAITIWILRWITEKRKQKKQVVLIVDDDPLIVDAVGIYLNKKGYATLKAFSGKECLDILKTRIADIILLDVLMQPMDGWQTLEQIKKNPVTRSMPVLMLTGKELTATEAKQYNLQIADYIMKPFKLADIYIAVDSILKEKQKLMETLLLMKQAGIEREKFCEFASLTRRISINKKILEILDVPQASLSSANLNTLDDMLVVDYINVKTSINEKRVEELQNEINTTLKSKGLPELFW